MKVTVQVLRGPADSGLTDALAWDAVKGYVLSGVERTGPPDGGPARVAPTGRVAAGGAWQTNDAANRRISRQIGGDGPAGVSTTAGSS